MPFESLKDEWEDEMNEIETSTEWQIHVFNETLIFFFKGSNGKELVQLAIPNSSNLCQLCNMMGHNASSCLKFFEKPKCGKCRGGHKMENCGLKCSYCFGLSHIDERCWKKIKKGLPTTTNYLEVLVNDEEATLT